MLPHFVRLQLFSIAASAAVCGGAMAQGTAPGNAAGESPGKVATDEVTGLQRKLVSVGEALAASNRELLELREQHAQLKLQMEALGVAAIKGDARSLQQRLLKAAADLRESEKANTELLEKSSRLAEASAAFMARPGDQALKAALEEALKAVTSSKRSSQSELVSLEAAKVVSYKADLGLAVINAGLESGVRMGAPFRVVRADRSIASGLIVDVRDHLAGLLLTGAAPGAIRVGDAVKPEITQPPSKK